MKCNKPRRPPDGRKKFVVKACGGSTETINEALKHIDEQMDEHERLSIARGQKIAFDECDESKRFATAFVEDRGRTNKNFVQIFQTMTMKLSSPQYSPIWFWFL